MSDPGASGGLFCPVFVQLLSSPMDYLILKCSSWLPGPISSSSRSFTAALPRWSVLLLRRGLLRQRGTFLLRYRLRGAGWLRRQGRLLRQGGRSSSGVGVCSGGAGGFRGRAGGRWRFAAHRQHHPDRASHGGGGDLLQHRQHRAVIQGVPDEIVAAVDGEAVTLHGAGGHVEKDPVVHRQAALELIQQLGPQAAVACGRRGAGSAETDLRGAL